MLEYTLFHHLPHQSQVDLLAQKGTSVAQRYYKDWHITLYSLNNYFVERWQKNGLDIVATFKASASPMVILEPYTDNVQIPPLHYF